MRKHTAVIISICLLFVSCVLVPLAMTAAINTVFETDCVTIAPHTGSGASLNPTLVSNSFALTHATQTIMVSINATSTDTVGMEIHSGQAFSWSDISYSILSVYNHGTASDTVCATHGRQE